MFDGTNTTLINSILNKDEKAEAFYYFTEIYNVCNKSELEFGEILDEKHIMEKIYPRFEQLIADLTLLPIASNDNWKK
jgi:hypothetical protein